MLPYFGCAQETHQTAPSWLEKGVSEEGKGRERGRKWVPFQRFGQPVGIAFYFEDLYCAVGGAGCKAAAVIIEYCIVLRKSVLVLIKEEVRCRKTSIRVERGPYYHVIMT
jgi:hypothetical protein